MPSTKIVCAATVRSFRKAMKMAGASAHRRIGAGLRRTATDAGSAARIAVYPVKIENNKAVIQLQMADQEVFADCDGPCVR